MTRRAPALHTLPDPLRRRWLAAGSLALALPVARARTPVLQVGPGRDFKTLAEAARHARDGDTIEVDAGDYRGDVAVWPQSGLQLQAVGGRVRLLADGQSIQGKGIWVMRGERLRVQGFDFEQARVPSLNGAGIRLERGTLEVVDCRFFDNECGILTANERSIELSIERCEFGRQVRADGKNHHVYAGAIGRLTVQGSSFSGARSGHLLKSRAQINHVAWNRLADGADGQASYELEFPNGGQALVLGNVIQQGPQTENPNIVSFGAEGYATGPNELVMAFNTLVNERRNGGIFLAMRPGADRLRLVGNLLVGPGLLAADHVAAMTDLRDNPALPLADLVNPAQGDYRLRRTAAARLTPVTLTGDDADLLPRGMFTAPRGWAARPPAATLLPGALPPGT